MAADKNNTRSPRNPHPAASGSPWVVGVSVDETRFDALVELIVGICEHPESIAGLAIVVLQSGRVDDRSISPLHLSSPTQLTDTVNQQLQSNAGSTDRSEARFKFADVKQSAKLKPGTVYLPPVDAELKFSNGVLHVLPAATSDEASPRHRVDDFFCGLADDQADRAVGVILNVEESDGVLGIEAIAESGGMTYVAKIDDAKTEPDSNVRKVLDLADRVLTPSEIANDLVLRIAGRTQQTSDLETQIQNSIPKIAKILRSATGHNFEHYRISTLVRRIKRRMESLAIDDVPTFVQQIENDDEQRRALFGELLVSVTEFFRDDEAFEVLAKKVIPSIFAGRKSSDYVRVWVAGCATGEEAYSVAMLCREQIDQMDDPPEVRIFATDIDTQALEVARKGRYPVTIEDSISSARRKRFFQKSGDQYGVTKELRELVLFSAHDVIGDPPFSKIDLLCCRNLLIYLGPHLQKKLIPLFHFAIGSEGYLFLGPSENLIAHGDLFDMLNSKWRIAQRRDTGVGRTEPLVESSWSTRDKDGVENGISASGETGEQDLLEVMQRIVLDEFSPKSVVVNQQGEIICASADMKKYLAVGTGNFHNNIIKMARDGLRSGLRSVLQEAKTKRRRIVRDDLSVKVGDDLQRVMLTVQPMPKVGEDAELFMVIFHDAGLPIACKSAAQNEVVSPAKSQNDADASLAISAAGTEHRGGHVDEVVAHLERHLATTRHDLEKSLLELESTNEQLQASNFDLVSLNEEMLSANEELATSKEEIESAVVAQTKAKDDLENLLRSTQVATIFLDDELRICRFTPAATEIYGLIESDIGRPLAQLMPMADSIPPLPTIDQCRASQLNGGENDAQDLSHTTGDAKRSVSVDSGDHSPSPAFATSDPIAKEHTFKTHSGKWFRRRVLPYVSQEYVSQQNVSQEDVSQQNVDQKSVNQANRSNGIVLTFIDVTAERKAQQSAIRQQQQLKTLTDNMPALIAYLDADLRHRFVNQAYANQFQSTPKELIGTSVADVWGDSQFSILKDHLQAAISGQRRVFEIEIETENEQSDQADESEQSTPFQRSQRSQRPDQSQQRSTKEITYVPDFSAGGTVGGVYVLAVDVTLRKRWEQVLLDRESYLRQVIDNIGGFVGILETDGTLVDANKAATLAGGIAREEVIGKPFWDCYWWTHDDQAAENLKRAIATAAGGELVRYDVEVRMANDSRMMIDLMIAPVLDDDGNVIFLIPSGVDIGDRVEAQEHAIRRLRQLNLATEVGRLGGWTWDLATDAITWSQRLHEFFGYQPDQFEGTPAAFLEIVVPEDRTLVQSVITDVIEGEIESFEYECRCIRGNDGRQIWTQVRGVVDRDAVGDAIRVTGVAADVTARKRRELALEFLAALQVELTDLQRADEIIEVTTSRVAEFLNLSHCVVIDIDDNAETANVFYDHHAAGTANLCGDYHMANFWSDDERSALVQGTLLAIDDTNDLNRPIKYRDSFQSVGIGAIVNAPSTRSQTLTFVLSAIKPTAYQWQPFETELLRELATSLYLRIERARTDAELIANKEQLQLGIEVANFAMGRVDYTTNEVTLSDEAAQLYGLGDQSMVVTRDEIHATFHPDDRTELDQCIAASLKPDGDNRISVEHRVMMPDGKTKWLNVRKRIFFARDLDPPVPSYAILVARDITQRKEAELAATLSAARMQMAAETAGFGMLHVDLTDRTVIYSDELRRLVGMPGSSSQRVRLDRLPSWIHPDDRELCRRYYIDVFTIPEHSDKSIDHRIVRPDGEVRWVELRSRPIYSGEGKSRRPSQLIGTMLDITQQRQFELSLEEARSMAELANQSKSEFLANMSHEIRTPMTAILGYAVILNRHLVDPDNRNCVSIIRTNGQFLLEIINDILDISKIEAGKLEIHPSEFRVDQLVTDVQSLMKVRATEKEITFDVRYAGSIPESIRSDQKRLKQVLINLVGNAIKFTHSGGVTLSISMESKSDQSCLKFEVTDTGIGMSPDQTKKLFQPFTQADSSVDRKFGGTGLGLTISQRIATMLDGDIGLSSELGKGSTFTLTIGIGKVSQPTLIHPQSQPATAHDNGSDAAATGGTRLTGNYLVVDDRREIRFIAQHFIEDAGGRVSVAENGGEAIAAVADATDKGTGFDVVVMDMQMPVMDGYEAARQLRKMNYSGPIIALTAHAMDGDRDACIEAGCTDYISKPLDGPKFVQRLARLAKDH